MTTKNIYNFSVSGSVWTGYVLLIDAQKLTLTSYSLRVVRSDLDRHWCEHVARRPAGNTHRGATTNRVLVCHDINVT